MPDPLEYEVDVGGLLTKLYDPDNQPTEKEFAEDLQYLEERLAKLEDRLKEKGLTEEQMAPVLRKSRSQVQLLRETKEAFFSARSESDDEG